MRPHPWHLTCLLLALAACTSTPAPPPQPPVVQWPAPPPAPVRVHAGSNDAWNAVGQILVRTPGVSYEGRSQMMGFYALRYRGEPLRIVTRAVLLSDTVRELTTEISATAPDATPAAQQGAAELLAVLERELPAEIEQVKRGLAAQAAAKREMQGTKGSKKAKKSRGRR